MIKKQSSPIKLTELQKRKVDFFFEQFGIHRVQIRPIVQILIPSTYLTGLHAISSAYGFTEPQVQFLLDGLKDGVSFENFATSLMSSPLFVHVRGFRYIQIR